MLWGVTSGLLILACLLYIRAALDLYLESMSCIEFESQPWDLKKANAFLLPPSSIARTCSSFQVSIVALRTKERCVPRARWRPEQSRPAEERQRVSEASRSGQAQRERKTALSAQAGRGERERGRLSCSRTAKNQQ